jgi:hypothetical protein
LGAAASVNGQGIVLLRNLGKRRQRAKSEVNAALWMGDVTQLTFPWICAFILKYNGHRGAMRRLGPQPLTGAEKQRRHRERVKARLAEADRLKAIFSDAPDGAPLGLSALYDSILSELGASREEREALSGNAGAILAELRAALEARAHNELDNLRAKKPKGKARPMSRLVAAKPGNH